MFIHKNNRIVKVHCTICDIDNEASNEHIIHEVMEIKFCYI